MTTIRVATVLDVADISRLWVMLTEETKFKSMELDKESRIRYAEQMVDTVRDENEIVLVSEYEDKITGFQHGSITFQPILKRKLRLTSVSTYIEKKHRESGIATLFTDEMVRIARDKTNNGIEQVDFMCHFDERVLQKWGKIGFQPSAVEVVRFENG